MCPDQIIMNLTQILASLGPKIWNSVKSTETFEEFKNFIKTWDDEICKCRMCIYNKNHKIFGKNINQKKKLVSSVKNIDFDSTNIITGRILEKYL